MRFAALPCAFTLAIAALALSACAATRDEGADPADKAPGVRVVGEAVSCIPRSQVRQSRVRSDRIIDFEMQNGKVYRVTMPQTCPGLAFERSFAYETSIDQLCSADIIYVLLNIGGGAQRGAACSLAPFVPVEYDPQRIRRSRTAQGEAMPDAALPPS
ncbi:MAG: hypothetical protein ACXIT4_04635 [Erythrobacter sp.]